MYRECGISSGFCHFCAPQIFFHDIIAHVSLAKPRAAAHAGSRPNSKTFSDVPAHALRKRVPPLDQEPPALWRSPLVISWQSPSGESTENGMLSRKQMKGFFCFQWCGAQEPENTWHQLSPPLLQSLRGADHPEQTSAWVPLGQSYSPWSQVHGLEPRNSSLSKRKALFVPSSH